MFIKTKDRRSGRDSHYIDENTMLNILTPTISMKLQVVRTKTDDAKCGCIASFAFGAANQISDSGWPTAMGGTD